MQDTQQFIEKLVTSWDIDVFKELRRHYHEEGIEAIKKKLILSLTAMAERCDENWRERIIKIRDAVIEHDGLQSEATKLIFVSCGDLLASNKKEK